VRDSASEKTIREISARLARLERAIFKSRPAESAEKPKRDPASEEPDLDFDAPERAFVKSHARNLSGPKKFVLLLAYFAKGKTGHGVALKDIERRWNRMTASNLLDGQFNRFYSNAAKENGWVDTKKPGAYFLRKSWRDIFK
jgi:hypothetical protein